MMDRETGEEPPGRRPYEVIFEPEPYPFKRLTSLDRVVVTQLPCAGDRPGCLEPALVVADPRRRPLVAPKVPSGASSAGRSAEREPFEGTLTLELVAGQWQPLPSVAPDVELRSARLDPPARVELAVDGAGNHWVRSPSPGRRTLRWSTLAPRSYFGGALPTGRRLSEIPSELRPSVPASVLEEAGGILRALSLSPSPSDDPVQLLARLVDYFRAFEPGALPSAREGSTYRALASSQRGVCRHRTFAFVLTAQAAGLPARYVENELHVFAETWLPGVGWRRVNLGGATLDIELVDADGHTPHRPAPDPLPEPAPFVRRSGPSPFAPPAGPPPPLSRSAAAPPGTTNAPRTATAEHAVDGAAAPATAARAAIPPTLDRAEARARWSAPSAPGQLPLRLTLEESDQRIARGAPLSIRGAARSATGQPARGLPVRLYLDDSSALTPLGELYTDADGRLRGELLVPAALRPGSYTLVAHTDGNGTWAAATTAP
jgi:hypothetical protein